MISLISINGTRAICTNLTERIRVILGLAGYYPHEMLDGSRLIVPESILDLIDQCIIN